MKIWDLKKIRTVCRLYTPGLPETPSSSCCHGWSQTWLQQSTGTATSRQFSPAEKSTQASTVPLSTAKPTGLIRKNARKGQPKPVRQIGPVETRLLTYGRVNGWVFGPWGEESQEIHSLVQRLARARVNILDQLPGKRGSAKSRAAQLSSLVSWVWRQLSFFAVQQ